MDGAQADREAALHAPQSRGAGLGAGTGAVAVEQLSELCFRRSGRGANQSVGQDKDENPGVGSMNPTFTKHVKVGQPPRRTADNFNSIAYSTGFASSCDMRSPL